MAGRYVLVPFAALTRPFYRSMTSTREMELRYDDVRREWQFTLDGDVLLRAQSTAVYPGDVGDVWQDPDRGGMHGGPGVQIKFTGSAAAPIGADPLGPWAARIAFVFLSSGSLSLL